MSNVGYATLTILPSAKGFQAALNKETGGSLGKAGADGGKAFGGGLLGGLKPVAGALAGIFAAEKIGGFFKGAISEASGLGESMNALNVVYGENSAGVQALGKDAAQSLGLSNLEFNNLATRFSSFSKTIAGEGGNVVGTLDDLTGRASDFASVMNLDVSDAAQLFQSGLAGESEPLRAFGIDLSAASVEAYAMANGIGEAGGELTEAEKVQARYGSLMEQTSGTAGDFANTQDSLANVTRRLSSQWADVSAKVGSFFLPILEKALGFVNSTALPGLVAFGTGIKGVADILFKGDFTGAGNVFGLEEDSFGVDVLFTIRERVIEGVDGVKSAFKILFEGDFDGNLFGLEEDSAGVDVLFTIREKVIGAIDSIKSVFSGIDFGGVFSTLGAAVLPLLPLFLQLFSSVSPLQVVFAAVAPLLPQIAAIFTQLASVIGGVLLTSLTTMLPIFTQLSTLISTTLGTVLAAVLPVAVQLITMLAAGFAQLLPVILPIIATVVQLATTLLSQLAPIFTQLVTAILPPVVAIFGMVVAAIGPLVTTIAAVLIPIIQALMPVVVTVFSAVAQVITSAMQIVQGIIQVVTGIISGNWSQVWDGIKNILQGVWNTIRSIVQGAVQIVWSVIQAALSMISSAWNAAWSRISSFLSNAWSNIRSAVQSGISIASSAIQVGLGLIQSSWNSAWTSVASYLLGVWEDVKGAVRNGISNVVGFLSGLGGQVLGAVSNLGGILVSVGSNMMQGLIQGVQSVAGNIAEAVLGPIRNSVSAVKDFLGIASPSRLFMEIGAFTGEGMAIGLNKSAGLVAKASEALIPATPAFRSPDVALGGIQGALAGSRVGAGGVSYSPTYQYMGEDPETLARRDRARLMDVLTTYLPPIPAV